MSELITDDIIAHLRDRITKLESNSQPTKPSLDQSFPTTGIVSRAYVCRYFGISKNTLMRWEMLGLKMIRLGTKSGYFFCADILEILQEFQGSELPKWKSKALQQIEARRSAKTQTKD